MISVFKNSRITFQSVEAMIALFRNTEALLALIYRLKQ
jgi:hypothetical protein